jgi:hypothetical protein
MRFFKHVKTNPGKTFPQNEGRVLSRAACRQAGELPKEQDER